MLVLTLLLAAQAGAQTPGPLRTRPERTEYRETSSYADVMDFVRRASTMAPRLLHPTTFGYTMEGRALPLVVVGRVRDASPAAVRASGKIRVFIQANIHAGEVEGKEAAQMLLRALARGEHATWFDSLVLLIAPIYNADGNERVKLTNRPLQNGPVGGMGQRANAQGLDLNRDHMKLESPEARSLVALFNAYDPQVVIDLHTTDGSFHGYHLTYAPPLHPNTDSAIVRLLRDDWLPAVTRAIKRRDGWDFYYYGDFPGPREPVIERGWYSFDARPRFNNNYVGLRNHCRGGRASTAGPARVHPARGPLGRRRGRLECVRRRPGGREELPDLAGYSLRRFGAPSAGGGLSEGALGGSSTLLTSRSPRLNSCIPFPIDAPISGIRFAPNTSINTTTTIRICQMLRSANIDMLPRGRLKGRCGKSSCKGQHGPATLSWDHVSN